MTSFLSHLKKQNLEQVLTKECCLNYVFINYPPGSSCSHMNVHHRGTYRRQTHEETSAFDICSC